MKPARKLLAMFRDAGVSQIALSQDGHLLNVAFSEAAQLSSMAEKPVLSTFDDEEDLEKAKAERLKRMQQDAESLLYGGPVSRLGEQA